MEPRIQYAQTTDGVSIAYYAMGNGIPLVTPPPAMPWSHLQMEWEIPEWRAWTERLMERTTVVRYDGRGAGLSDRDREDFSLETQLLDLEAVVDRLGLDQFALFGCFHASLVSIAYAARHPERVSHLALWCGLSRESDSDHAQAQALTQLRDANWELFTETLAHSLFGWSEGEPAHRLALYMRASLAQDLCKTAWDAHDKIDLTDQLSLIQAPTLVMHRRDFPQLEVSVARNLAARIPDAHLALLEGSSVSPYIGDTETPMRLLFEFLGTRAHDDEEHDHAHDHAAPSTGVFRTILFSDIEDSTGLGERLGDAAAREILRTHEQIVRDALHVYGGAEIKTMGDGFMASFGSATRAVECAIAIERAVGQHNETAHEPVDVRIGLNAGEPIAEEDDLFGTSVNLAARIAAKAAGGDILASDVVRQLVAGKGFLFADRGDTALRGFEDPVRLYEVRWRETA